MPLRRREKGFLIHRRTELTWPKPTKSRITWDTQKGEILYEGERIWFKIAKMRITFRGKKPHRHQSETTFAKNFNFS
jgi:hypothetical protein